VTRSFVVKIWLEEERGIWRGHITNVHSGERRYFEELSDILDFIAPYVEGMKTGRTRGLWRWLSARKRNTKSNRKHGG